MAKSEPRRLDKVYDLERKRAGLQPNGYIAKIDKEYGEITVKFHECLVPVEYDVDQFSPDMYNDKFNQWFPYGEPDVEDFR